MSEHVWNSIQFDSLDEAEFAYWLEELKQAGYVKEWKRAETYKLTNGLTHPYVETKKLKTKTKVENKVQTLLQPSYYTPDFEIVWMAAASNIFVTSLHIPSKLTKPLIENNNISIVEIKPTFDFKNMTRAFELNRKFMWERYQLYVNLIHIPHLFDKTFTPTLSTFTPTGKKRKITKWKPRTLNQFLNDKN